MDFECPVAIKLREFRNTGGHCIWPKKMQLLPISADCMKEDKMTR